MSDFRARIPVFLLLLVLSTACAANPSASNTRTDRDRITREEIEATDVTNAYDLVQRLRPRWLTVRGPRSLGALDTGILVYVNDSRMGGAESLRNLEPEGIIEMQYLDGPKASATLPGIGSAHVAGAIVIKTAQRR